MTNLSSWIAGEFKSSSITREFKSPFDGSVIASIHEAQGMDFVQSLAAVKSAQENLLKSTAVDRAEWLTQLASAMESQAAAIASRCGFFEGLSADFVHRKAIRPALELARNLASELRADQNEFRQSTGLTAVVVPATLAFRSIAERLLPALAAGNAVMVKVPSGSPVQVQIWADLFAATKFPTGAANFYLGSGKELGPFLVSHPSIRAVSFLGHPQTGRFVAENAMKTFKKLQVSAGAKNSLVILEVNALAQHSSEIMESLWTGAGHFGLSMTNVFALESQMEEVKAFFLEQWQKASPLSSERQSSFWTPQSPELIDRSQSVFESVKAERGHVIAGMERQGAFHLKPALVTDLTHCSPLQIEETPAPVVLLNAVKYSHEVAKWTNTGDYGLCASLYGDDEKARRLGTKLDVGQVWVNSWLSGAEAFAGLRKSFFGNPDFRWPGSFFSDVKKLT